MSALGQKQTDAAQKVMSALTPKADMCSATWHVRFVPIADIPKLTPGTDGLRFNLHNPSPRQVTEPLAPRSSWNLADYG